MAFFWAVSNRRFLTLKNLANFRNYCIVGLKVICDTFCDILLDKIFIQSANNQVRKEKISLT